MLCNEAAEVLLDGGGPRENMLARRSMNERENNQRAFLRLKEYRGQWYASLLCPACHVSNLDLPQDLRRCPPELLGLALCFRLLFFLLLFRSHIVESTMELPDTLLEWKTYSEGSASPFWESLRPFFAEHGWKLWTDEGGYARPHNHPRIRSPDQFHHWIP